MNQAILLQKKKHFEAIKLALEIDDGADEIEKKVEAYRQQLQTEFEASKQQDLTKASHYIELIDMLIEEDNINDNELTGTDVETEE